MNFVHDFSKDELASLIGKSIQIVFADKTPPLTGEIVRFTSAADNDGEYASAEIVSEDFKGSYVSIFENEIAEINVL